MAGSSSERSGCGLEAPWPPAPLTTGVNGVLEVSKAVGDAAEAAVAEGEAEAAAAGDEAEVVPGKCRALASDCIAAEATPRHTCIASRAPRGGETAGLPPGNLQGLQGADLLIIEVLHGAGLKAGDSLLHTLAGKLALRQQDGGTSNVRRLGDETCNMARLATITRTCRESSASTGATGTSEVIIVKRSMKKLS